MVSELANLDVEVMCAFICVDTRQNGRFGLILCFSVKFLEEKKKHFTIVILLNNILLSEVA